MGKRRSGRFDSRKTERPKVFVVICDPDDAGTSRAQMMIGTKRSRCTPLTAFSKEIRDAFGDDPKPGWSLLCEDVENPKPDVMKPRPGATPQLSALGRPSSPSNAATHRQSPGHSANVRITGYEDDHEGVVFNPRHIRKDRNGRDRGPYNVDSLGVTDRFLAARPGSEFKVGRDLALSQYSDDVADGDGLQSTPDIDQNPYNFVPWMDGTPRLAEQPREGTHDRLRTARFSGSIDVTFTARTPIFVPAADIGAARDEKHSDPPRDFFRCWNGAQDRYAIPGSSVKGAVRSVFEALTNSRVGVTDSGLKWPQLYRRRAFRLYRIVSMPTATAAGEVEECKYGLYDRYGKPKRYERDLSMPSSQNDVEECEFSANLFFVAPHSRNVPNGHTHRWTKIRYRPTGRRLALEVRILERFKAMKGHPHLTDHGGPQGNAASAAKCFYGSRNRAGHAPDYSAIKEQLFQIKKGDLIFGIPDRDNRSLRCFGRNVNFLWPSDKSTRDLIGKFTTRAANVSALSDSDPAEAVFGFAGTHGDNSHPFQGRVRFGVFWGPDCCDGELASRPSLRLMPLTSPSGSKAKSRPLYLTGRNGKAADHDEHARLRGRKFYWHQRAKGNKEGDDVPPVHRLDAVQRNVPEAWTEKIASQLPAPIRPLPECSDFQGKVHFINLTSAELGALLISLQPDLAFESENEQKYGLKIGKGKPRGLGSVTTELELRVARRPQDAYASLDSPVTAVAADQEVRKHVHAYKEWITPNGKRWGELDLAKALKALLRLPDGPSARVYPPQFAMYGWLPAGSDQDVDRAARGAPRGEYPKAMTPAHDM